MAHSHLVSVMVYLDDWKYYKSWKYTKFYHTKVTFQRKYYDRMW